MKISLRFCPSHAMVLSAAGGSKRAYDGSGPSRGLPYSGRTRHAAHSRSSRLLVGAGAGMVGALVGAGPCLSSACFSSDSVQFSEGRVRKRNAFLGVGRTSDFFFVFLFFFQQTDVKCTIAGLCLPRGGEGNGGSFSNQVGSPMHVCLGLRPLTVKPLRRTIIPLAERPNSPSDNWYAPRSLWNGRLYQSPWTNARYCWF